MAALAGGLEHGQGGLLDRVADAVELGGVAAVPQRVQRHRLALVVAGRQLLGDDGAGQPGAGEAGGLREAAELDGHLARARDLVDAVHLTGLADEGLVGGVEQDDRLVLAGVLHPAGQRGARQHRAGGVVGRAEVDEVDLPVGQRRVEAVLGGGGQVDQPAVAAAGVGGAGAAGHDVGVDVDRVDRVGHRHHVVDGEDLLHVARVALGAVGDEHLVGGDLRRPGGRSRRRSPRAGTRSPARDRNPGRSRARPISSAPAFSASTMGGGSGSTTSPMPSRMILAPGFWSAKARTRLAISENR